MNRAFERHAAYMDQAWRTLQDSVLLKRQETHAQRQNRLQRGRVQGAIPLVDTPPPQPRPQTPPQDGPTQEPNRLLGTVLPPSPSLGDTSSGPTHIRNVPRLSAEDKAAQEEIHAKMAKRAEQRLIRDKINEYAKFGQTPPRELLDSLIGGDGDEGE